MLQENQTGTLQSAALPMLGKPKEGQVVNACFQYLWRLGCFIWRQNTGAYKPEGSRRFIRYGTPGCADIIGSTPYGRFLAVECKTENGKQRESQEIFEANVRAKNGIYILARSVDDLEARKAEIVG